jgi:uroporphyrinogen-III decarboxylase
MVRPFTEFFGYYLSILANLVPFGLPEVAGALEALATAGTEALKWAMNLAEQSERIRAMGFPSMMGGSSAAPYDIIGDWFRGTRGVMLDMYRRPEQLWKAMDRLAPILVKMGVDQARQSGNPIVGLMLHKGLEGFMSLEQYKSFYWPTLRKVMMGLIDGGMVPLPLFEGENTSRLEIIKDIPRGTAIYWFETVDIVKAKATLGDTVCFRGNVPISLLYTGTPQQVKEYVKKLIDVVGKGGGLMVDCGIWFDEARHENVKAMVEVTKEYGAYKR